ncbi:MAG TPA: M20/M25/M40 family metallo-hydrolase [Chlamydiales bacterium]|nr:M20/M25/M40 family metallo-hydrolase [Chlamydiales bacterium]
MLDITSWYEQHFAQIRADYFRFLKFRSISTEPEFNTELIECAKWVRDYLTHSGFTAKLIETTGHPLVFAEKKAAHPDKPTVLIYGHYDVQPIDPIELWESDPFEPTERDNHIFARGAADDKGQIFYAMVALRCLHELKIPLPANVKFCIEGEEECGSLGLTHALPTIKNMMKADSLLVVDFNAYDEKTPAISLGARGIGTFDVTLTGSTGDLHSGSLGGIAYNPNRALVELLSKLYDEEGKVAVDGFYDDVIEPSSEERHAYPAPHDKSYYTKAFGLEAFAGEKGRSLHEANVFRPTLEINGMAGGYFGAGFKTVIPSKAVAKLSCRLVPGQDPEKIRHQIQHFLQKHCVRGMHLEIAYHGGAPAFRGSLHSKLALAVSEAAEKATGVACKKMIAGGSVPVIAELAKAIQADAVGMGYGLETDKIHAPNEHFDFHRFKLGFITVAGAIKNL